MANFKTHLGVAAVVSGGGALLLYDKVGVKDALFLFVSGCIGGILPDIDHDNSIPLRILQNISTLFVVFFVFLFFYDKVNSLMLLIFMITGYIGSFLLFYIFKKFTTHRGIIHSISFGVLLALLFNFVIFEVSNNQKLSLLAGFFLFLGYVTHLILDEIYSIDFMGRRIKKSFGSALKLKGENQLLNLILIFAILLTFLLPPNYTFLLEILKDLND
ncbi:MAG: metal-dependent hydrolase [Nautiliaceae bacterium]